MPVASHRRGGRRRVRPDGHTRLRWQADHAGALWHGDVCHGPTLRIGTTTRPPRIPALLDDTSRFVLALEAHHTEREVDMLDLLLAHSAAMGPRRLVPRQREHLLRRGAATLLRAPRRHAGPRPPLRNVGGAAGDLRGRTLHCPTPGRKSKHEK